jgi:hypothetical protein
VKVAQGHASAAAHRSGRAIRRLTVALLSLLSLGLPPGAAAQDEGVFFDPGSPAGKEYAIPLEQARREAAGGGRPDGSATLGRGPAAGGGAIAGGGAGRAAPLFGAGISQRGSSRRGAGDRQRGSAQGRSAEGVPLSATGSAGAGGEGPSGTLWALGAAAGVLIAGCILGLLMRLGLRRRSSSS